MTSSESIDHGNCGFHGKSSHKIVVIDVFKQKKKDDSLLPVTRFQYLMCHLWNIGNHKEEVPELKWKKSTFHFPSTAEIVIISRHFLWFHTIIPLMPGRPGSPGLPGLPSSPFWPWGPRGPTSPFSPLGPFAPCGPRSPLSPPLPGTPVCPGSPETPYQHVKSNITYTKNYVYAGVIWYFWQKNCFLFVCFMHLAFPFLS